MPPEPFYDLSRLDQSKLLATHEQIRQINPHRYEFELLDGIFTVDQEANVIVGYRDVRSDEFWARGHIPGRPLLPGVLIIETAAQLVSWYVKAVLEPGPGFLGFGAADAVKFRGQVVPGDRLIMVGKMLKMRPKRLYVGATQGFVNGQMVYEGAITGIIL